MYHLGVCVGALESVVIHDMGGTSNSTIQSPVRKQMDAAWMSNDANNGSIIELAALSSPVCLFYFTLLRMNFISFKADIIHFFRMTGTHQKAYLAMSSMRTLDVQIP